jgi:3'-5' exoribonuclease
MKSPYVKELQPNQVFTSTFLVQLKDIRQKKTGEPYLSLLLGDRTGELDAKMWDNVVEVMDTFERDDFVKVKGLLQIYQNRPQLTIHKMMKIHDGDVDFADYFPASERNPEEMFAELRRIVAEMENPHLRRLLDAFMDDENFARLYRTAPAAKSVHHAFLGGLLEHVLSLCKLCKLTTAHYPYVDADLVLTGVILHDMGKIAELTYDRSFGYSAEGQLLGHIVIGLRMLTEKLARIPDFPPKLRMLVEHLIVSHHGEVEFGSPKVPLFPEAMLLHHLDNLDSKMECMRAMLAKDRHTDGYWTSYNAALERSVFKRDVFLGVTATPQPCEPPVAPPAPELNQQIIALPASAPPAPPTAPPVAIPAPPAKPALPAAKPSPPPPYTSVSPKPKHAEPPREKTMSLFAEKLNQAWQKET